MNRGLNSHSWFSLATVLAAVSGLLLAQSVYSQNSKARPKGATSKAAPAIEDFAKYVVPLTGDESPIAPQKKITLHLSNGKTLTEFEVTESLLGKGNETLKFLSIADPDGKKKQKLPSTQLTRIVSGERQFELVFDSAKKGHVLIDVTARDADVDARLRSQRQSLWPEQTDEERAKTVADYKEFLERVQASYQAQSHLHETQFFLFFTDLPANQIPQYVANLDKMYVKLCEAFGVPKTKNLFLGKCIICAFMTEESYLAFEQKFLDNPNAKGTQGLYHGSSDGRAIIACFRGNTDAATLGAVMVHETTHGVTSRIRSTVSLPPWLGEGMADWVAHAVVPRSSAAERQKRSVEKAQRSGSLGGNFFETQTNFEAWQYDIASHLVNFMVQLDSGRFRSFFLSIKEGDTPEEALDRCYGMSPAELLAQYGRSIGVANLRP